MGTPDHETLARKETALAAIQRRKSELISRAQSLLETRRAAGAESLDPADSVRFRAMKVDIDAAEQDERDMAEAVREYRSELERCGTVPANLQRAVNRTVNSAGRLSPFLPPQLFPQPIGWQHENRLLDKLPGFAVEQPSITYIRHISTTGDAAAVSEGALKPELEFVTDQMTVPMSKLAANVAVSREVLDDWMAWSQQYVPNELFKRIIDCENAALLTGDGVAPNMLGFFKCPGTLTHDCALDVGTTESTLDSIEKAITALRVGPALAVPDLAVFNPVVFSAMRRIKDGMQRFMLAPDPSRDEVNTLWGIDITVTTACPQGKGLLIDSQKFGRAAIRSPLSLRLGFSNDDFSRNLYRLVGETRLALTIERPSAVCEIKNLPAVTTATAAAKK